ncbi:hypothetical protein [Streptomyces sp. MAR4 CNX-425]|uniref:hypothetical protein n=1 Tax=Streptomyces sp. MAR4 CNX-425 TaxID=3406343 RepID=UPI003B508D57
MSRLLPASGRRRRAAPLVRPYALVHDHERRQEAHRQRAGRRAPLPTVDGLGIGLGPLYGMEVT